ncbi:type II toxin-antitoxin system HipA family toxin [Leucobacter sp. HY1910]
MTDLQRVAELVSQGESLPPALHDAILSGTGIGGARPKSLVAVAGTPSLVKFSVTTDVFPAVEAEALASKLAHYAGVSTAPVQARNIQGRYALISERFDRVQGARRLVVSALTISGKDELSARFGTYPELVEKVARLASQPELVGPELFKRVAFNMAISNNDDHLRNHAAFWDGSTLELTPAYDLAPAARREGAEVTQTLAYGKDGEKLASLAALIRQSAFYGLSRPAASNIVDELRVAIANNFSDAADEMRIPAATLAIVRSSFLHETVTRDLPRAIAFQPVTRPSPRADPL